MQIKKVNNETKEITIIPFEVAIEEIGGFKDWQKLIVKENFKNGENYQTLTDSYYYEV